MNALRIFAIVSLALASNAFAGGECAKFCESQPAGPSLQSCLNSCLACKTNYYSGGGAMQACFCAADVVDGGNMFGDYCTTSGYPPPGGTGGGGGGGIVPPPIGGPIDPIGGGGGGGNPIEPVRPITPTTPVNENLYNAWRDAFEIAKQARNCAALWSAVQSAPTDKEKDEAMTAWTVSGCATGVDIYAWLVPAKPAACRG